MQTLTNPLERLREQRAQRLLEILQDDLRAQTRQEGDAAGRRGCHDPPRNAQQRLQRKIAQLAEPATREQVWNRVEVPQFQGVPINDLPKTRAFWEGVDVTSWTKAQLDVACELLDLVPGGRKAQMVARLQDWVHAPAIRAAREQQERVERDRERVLAAGRVFAWGHNFHGELGLGDRVDRRVPTEIELFRGQEIKQVVSGFDTNFAFAIASDGRVFAWGGGGKSLADTTAERRADNADRSSNVAIGMAHLTSGCFLLPRLVTELSGRRVETIASARSDGHIAFTTVGGSCFTWGRGGHGELGFATGDAAAEAQVQALQPVQVTAFNVEGTPTIVQASVGNCHTAAITNDGDLFTWGASWSGQLGLGTAKRKGVRQARLQFFFPTPTQVEAFAKTRVMKVSCGAVHTAVISADGHLFTFGCSDGGRLGHGAVDSNGGTDETIDVLHPELVRALEKDVVLDIVCSSWHSLCLARSRGDFAPQGEGFVYAFGHGMHGQLGLGKQRIAAIPTRLPEFVHRKVRCCKISAASHHSCALSADGKLFTWGQNASGCLGRELPEGSVDATEPDVVSNLSGFGVGPIISIACGHRFTLVATGPWEPLEQATMFELNERLNRHVRVPVVPHTKKKATRRCAS